MFVAIVLACFVCGAISREEVLSQENKCGCWKDLSDPNCQFIAHKMAILNDEQIANKYASNIKSAQAQGNAMWKHFCASSGALTKYTKNKNLLFDEEAQLTQDKAQGISKKPTAPETDQEQTGLVPEAILIEAKRSVKSMVKRGLKDKDCADLADKMCKEVEAEVRTSQNTLSTLKDGSHCATRGAKEVRFARKELAKWKTKLVKARQTKKDAGNYRVKFPAREYSSLQEGRCGAFWTTKVYRQAKANYKKAAATLQYTWGRVREATKELGLAISNAFRRVTKCMCDTRSTFKTTWRTESKKTKKWKRDYTKCNYMRCVIKGTLHLKNGSINPKCKAQVPALITKTLTTSTRNASCLKGGVIKGIKEGLMRVKRL